jgi:protein-S-isoprenylcysteine O-methyltransferase Ste14
MAGIAISAFGLAICIWARRSLGGNWSAPVTFKEEHELVMHGPYRFVRHPIYTGILLMMLGTVLVLGRLDSLLGLAVRLVVYRFKIRNEEGLMTEHFPNAYPEYRRQTGALLPFI